MRLTIDGRVNAGVLKNKYHVPFLVRLVNWKRTPSSLCGYFFVISSGWYRL